MSHKLVVQLHRAAVARWCDPGLGAGERPSETQSRDDAMIRFPNLGVARCKYSKSASEATMPRPAITECRPSAKGSS